MAPWRTPVLAGPPAQEPEGGVLPGSSHLRGAVGRQSSRPRADRLSGGGASLPRRRQQLTSRPIDSSHDTRQIPRHYERMRARLAGYPFQRRTVAPMRTKTNTRTIALAGRSLKSGPGKNRRSFTSGLFLGLSAASLFLAGELPRPRAPKEGIASDWNAVGSDLSHALNRHGG